MNKLTFNKNIDIRINFILSAVCAMSVHIINSYSFEKLFMQKKKEKDEVKVFGFNYVAKLGSFTT